MPSIGDAIFKLMGKDDPRQLLQAAMAGGQPPQPGSTPSAGGTAPGTTAPAAPPEASVYQSPNQLMDLYMQLQDRQERNRQIDRGIGFIGASLAHPENRPGILAAFNRDMGEDPKNLIGGLLNFQTKTAELSQKAAQRNSVPAIASKYGLDPTTALYLFDTGKLDSVIAELEKPERQIATDAATGQSYIIDLQNGQTIGEPFGTPKQREIEIADGPNGSKIPVYKDTKEPVAGREPTVPAEGNTEFERNYQNALRERPDLTREAFRRETNTTTQRSFTDRSGRTVGDPPKDMVWDLDENGNVKVDERNAPIALPIGGASADLDAKKAEREAADAKAAEETKRANQAVTALTIGDEVDRVLKTVEDNKDSWIKSPVGIQSMVTQNIPGTPAYQVGRLLETIKGNAGFSKLQSMRDASPTGAALGPVSDFENKLLQATAGNLEQAQDPEDIIYNLKRIKKQFAFMAFNKVDTAEKAEAMWRQIKSEIDAEMADETSIDQLMEKYK